MSTRSSPDKSRAQHHEHEIKREADGEVQPLSTLHLCVKLMYSETELFRALPEARPIGQHKHMIIIKLQALIHHRTQVTVPVEKLWEMLGELYDLEALDEMASSSSVSLPTTPEKLSPVVKPTKKKQAPSNTAGSGSELSDVSSSPSPPPTSKRPAGRKGNAGAAVSKSAAVINSKHFQKTFELPGVAAKAGVGRASDDEAEEEEDGEVFREMALSRAGEDGRDENWEGPGESAKTASASGRAKGDGAASAGDAETSRSKGKRRGSKAKQNEETDDDAEEGGAAGNKDDSDDEQAEEDEDENEDEKPKKKHAKTYSRQNARASTRRSTRDKKARSSSLSGDEADENEDEEDEDEGEGEGEDGTATGAGSEGEDESEDDKEESPEEEPQPKRRGRPAAHGQGQGQGKRKRDSGEGVGAGAAASTRGRTRTATVEKEESEEEAPSRRRTRR